MSNIGNKYKVGVFAVVAFAILILGLVSLGTLKYFRTTWDFMTVVSASVQGLEKGAKVKIKGVTIGSVEKIQLGPEMKVTYIYMKFDPEAFSKVASLKYNLVGLSSQEMRALFGKRMAECVQEGLRCQLGYGDITGTLFIDIAYFDPKQYPPRDFELPAEHPPYIPAVPTVTIGSIITEVSAVTKNLAQVDLKGLSDDLKTFINKSNKILDETEFKKIFGQVDSISENLNALIIKANDVLDKKRVEEITDNINTTFRKIDSTLDSIQKLSEQTKSEIKDSKLADTTEKARNLIDTSEATVKNLNLLKADLKGSIDEFNVTLQSAKELFDYLQRNPGSVLSGNPEKPVVNPE